MREFEALAESEIEWVIFWKMCGNQQQQGPSGIQHFHPEAL